MSLYSRLALIFKNLDAQKYGKIKNYTIRKLAQSHAHQFNSVYFIISFVGYENKTIAINGRTVIDVVLVSGKELSEVVFKSGEWCHSYHHQIG